MKSTKYESREEWLEARKGKITGSRLKDIVVKRGTGKKIGFYELIAERIAVPELSEETPMDRGTRLESEAMARFIEETGKQVNTDLVLWQHEDNENIALSPDGYMDDEAVEVKCLSSARHIEAYLTQQVPDDYEMQKLQYFIVNPSLQRLHFAFYDPRIACKDFFVITTEREAVAEQIDTMLQYQKDVLTEVEQIVRDLTF